MHALIAFLGTFALSYATTLALLRRVPVGRFVDVPNERSSHDVPKPRFGGIAIVAAFVAGYAFLVVVEPAARAYAPVVLGGVLLFVTGLFDDWRGLGVGVRFAVQIAAAALLVVTGNVIESVQLPVVGEIGFGWFSVPVTVLFVVASVNFYNFIDGIDGLAAGSAFIASLFLALVGMIVGNPVLGMLFLLIAGSAVGFLQFNFPPSRLFMGDGGSTFLGYVFAALAVSGNNASLPLFVPLLILSSLYLDAGLTLFNRLMRRERIFQPHHTHYYQRLLSLGLNHKQVTLLEYLVVVLLGASAVVYFKAGEFFTLFLTVCWLAVFTGMILKIRGLERGDRLFWERRGLFVVATDVVLIAVAYVGAYFLRMNFEFTQAEGGAMLRALPIVIVVRTACFFKYGLYRTVWKYTSVSDVVRVVKAVTTGSVIILTAVVILYRFVAFPRTLFVIEYVLLTLLILGSRFAFRLFHEIGKESHGGSVRRLGIVGAGDLGESLAREVKNRDGGRSVVACFIDDDAGKHGLTLHGAPIAGPLNRLADVVREYDLDALVPGIRNLADDRAAEIVRVAREVGVEVEAGRSGGAPGIANPEIVFDRIARQYGRAIVGGDPATAAETFGGRRVLVTQGGDRIGAGLVRRLLHAGASVTVQFASARERALAGDSVDDAVVFLGGLGSMEKVQQLVDEAQPDVVFHCMSLDAHADRNVDDYLWEELVATVARVKRSVTAFGARLTVLSFWDGHDTSHRSARVAAVAEGLALNAGPARLVRLPRVLTSADVRGVTGGADGGPWDLLEPEAAGVALEAAREETPPGIYVPSWRGRVTPAHVRAVIAGAAEATLAGESTAARAHGPLFPAEQIVGEPVPGVKAVSTPLFPADERVERVFGAARNDSDTTGREEWMTVVASELFQIVPSGLRVEG